MGRRILRHLRSHVIAYLALFFALTGTAMALPGTNSVDSGDIINGQVKSVDILNDRVNTLDLQNNQVRSDDVRDDTLANGGLGASDLQPDSVGTSEIQNDSVTAPKLAGTTDGITSPSVPANGTLSVTVNCPAGGQAISGGYFTPTDGSVRVTRSRRDSDSAWAFTFRNTLGTAQGVDARVTCLVG